MIPEIVSFVTRREGRKFLRLKPAIDAGIPVTNYGMAIAYMQGVYERAIAPFINSAKEEMYSKIIRN